MRVFHVACGVVFLFLLAACAAMPTQAGRVIDVTPGREIAIAVGERVRINAPNTSIVWTLTGGDGVVSITAEPADRPAHWDVTGVKAGQGDVALEGSSAASCDDPATCPPPPAPPKIVFTITVSRD
jgi:hypothetical protein